MAYSELASIIHRVVRRSLFPHIQEAELGSKGGAGREDGHGGSEAKASRHPNAKERRQRIARCRALRTDIARFEAEFKNQHGHEPKVSERQPLAHTYSEYRQLKVAIRDDAARHIQAVVRGHVARVKYPIPSRQCRLAAGRSVSSRSSGWTSAAAVPTAPAPTSASKAAVSPAVAALQAKVNALRDEKTALKRTLRAFDNTFAEEHGRQPSKGEKEHLRPQYTRYHELKGLIAAAEAELEAAQSGAAATAAPAPAASAAATLAAASLSRRRADSVISTTSAPGTGAGGGGGGEEEEEEEGEEPMGARDAQLEGGTAGSGTVAASRGSSSGGTGGAPGGLAALKAEKRQLQEVLRDYEKDFAAKHGRGVKYVKDIAPVADKYQRYKHLKALLKETTGGGGSSSGVGLE